MPIFLVDPDGNLVFYNEPAEALLGTRFDETGEMPATSGRALFDPDRRRGRPHPAPKRLPLVIALHERRPAHGQLSDPRAATACAGTSRSTAFPLIGAGTTCLGAVAIFWEVRTRP